MAEKKCHPYTGLFYYNTYLSANFINLPDFRMYLRAGERQRTWSDVAGDA